MLKMQFVKKGFYVLATALGIFMLNPSYSAYVYRHVHCPGGQAFCYSHTKKVWYTPDGARHVWYSNHKYLKPRYR